MIFLRYQSVSFRFVRFLLDTEKVRALIFVIVNGIILFPNTCYYDINNVLFGKSITLLIRLNNLMKKLLSTKTCSTEKWKTCPKKCFCPTFSFKIPQNLGILMNNRWNKYLLLLFNQDTIMNVIVFYWYYNRLLWT